MNVIPPTITDLPLEIINQIAVDIDAPDLIALRQVHRLFCDLPIKLTNELSGLARVNATIISNYPNVYSFTGFEYGMNWFFELHLTHPGYNNIRRLEINQPANISGPLPRGLEELYIFSNNGTKHIKTRVDLSLLERLRVLKCRTTEALFPNLPDTIVDLEIDLMNLGKGNGVYDIGKQIHRLRNLRGLRRLKITNIAGLNISENGDFTKFTELESFDVPVDLHFDKLPPKLRYFCGLRIDCIDDADSVSKVIMSRPDSSISWDPRIHLIELEYALELPTDLSMFVNLNTLDIITFTGAEYKLPIGITKLVANYSMPRELFRLSNLTYLHLRGTDMTNINIDDVLPLTLIQLDLDRIQFTKYRQHMDFSRLVELKSLSIDAFYPPNGNDYTSPPSGHDLFMTCSIVNNHKLETLSLAKVKLIGDFPQSLIDISMLKCKFDSLKNAHNLKVLTVEQSHLEDHTIPHNLESLQLFDSIVPPLDISHLHALYSLSTISIDLGKSLPPNITKLSLIKHKKPLDISHLSRLASLTIDTRIESVDVGYVKGPLPKSLRYLNIKTSAQPFDLSDLPNLITLIK